MVTAHTIEAGQKPILDVFCDRYLFHIPSYQRPYAWEKEQASELLEDVVAHRPISSAASCSSRIRTERGPRWWMGNSG